MKSTLKSLDEYTTYKLLTRFLKKDSKQAKKQTKRLQETKYQETKYYRDTVYNRTISREINQVQETGISIFVGLKNASKTVMGTDIQKILQYQDHNNIELIIGVNENNTAKVLISEGTT